MLPLIEPIAPRKIAAPVDHPGMAWELKHDGFRALLYLEHGHGRLVSRRGLTMVRFQPLADALAREFQVAELILDGELVCLDDAGRSLFLPLLRRNAAPVFYAFDVLWAGAGDVRALPLTAGQGARPRRRREQRRPAPFARISERWS